MKLTQICPIFRKILRILRICGNWWNWGIDNGNKLNFPEIFARDKIGSAPYREDIFVQENLVRTLNNEYLLPPSNQFKQNSGLLNVA